MKNFPSLLNLCKSSTVLFLLVNFNLCDTYHLKILNKLGGRKRHFVAKARSKREADVAFGKGYLANYGYMSPGSLHSENGDVEELQSTREALMKMQEFLGLPQTGEFDEKTLKMMRKPRCANPDKDAIETNLKRRRKRYVKVGSKWQSLLITYSINNFTPKLGEKKTHEGIDDAFKVWSKHTPLQFKKVSYDENPDIVTFFAEGYHNDNTAFDGQGGYLAHAYYPGTGIGGDTHFDAAEPWTLHEEPYEGNDLFLVAVHELGHALGLGHSPNDKAIMAPVYRHHDTKNFQLPEDDILGIQSIYGKKFERPEIPLRPTTTESTTTRSTTKFYPWRTKRPGLSTKPPRPTTTTTTTTEPPLPDVCKLDRYDAVSHLRRELYVFSGSYMWRRRQHDTFMQGPYKISSFWPQLKDGVNAVFENPATNKIVFFKDHLYWEYNGITLLDNSPRHVRFLGLQNEHIGAAVWWERNGKTYLFQDSNYWRFSGRKVEAGYPKPVRVWKGVPTRVDAAFAGVDLDGRNHTYFVRGTSYWVFNNWDIKVVSGPHSFRKDWLKCDGVEDTKEVAPDGGISVAVVVVIVLLSVVLFVVFVVVLRRRSLSQTRNTKANVMHKPSPYTSGFVGHEAGKTCHNSGEKVMCVTAAQKRLRWFRFSLQGRV